MSEYGKYNKPKAVKRYSKYLDEYPVFLEESENSSFLEIEGLSGNLGYGKHAIFLSRKYIENSQHNLEKNSEIIFEFLDADRNRIYSGIADRYSEISNSAVIYFWIKPEDELQRINDFIKDGTGKLVILGNIDNASHTNELNFNYRFEKTFQIRKNFENASKIMFSDNPTLKTKSETINDDPDSNKKRQ